MKPRLAQVLTRVYSLVYSTAAKLGPNLARLPQKRFLKLSKFLSMKSSAFRRKVRNGLSVDSICVSLRVEFVFVVAVAVVGGGAVVDALATTIATVAD